MEALASGEAYWVDSWQGRDTPFGGSIRSASSADLTAPAMLFVQSIGRLGDIVNGEHCAKAWDFAFGLFGRIRHRMRVVALTELAYRFIP